VGDVRVKLTPRKVLISFEKKNIQLFVRNYGKKCFGLAHFVYYQVVHLLRLFDSISKIKENEMATRQKSYKFRLYPNQEQKQLFAKTFDCSRAIWNMMLADKIKHYEETKETLYNTPAQYKKEFPWLKEVDSLALANVQINLQTAYKNFFRSGFGFPKFKKKSHGQSYKTNNQKGSISLENGHIKLPKIGWVRYGETVLQQSIA